MLGSRAIALKLNLCLSIIEDIHLTCSELNLKVGGFLIAASFISFSTTPEDLLSSSTPFDISSSLMSSSTNLSLCDLIFLTDLFASDATPRTARLVFIDFLLSHAAFRMSHSTFTLNFEYFSADFRTRLRFTSNRYFCRLR